MSLIKDADGGLKVISMSDVIRHPLYNELSCQSLTILIGKGKTREVDGLEALLFTMGLDITLPYDIDFVEHRSEITQEVVKCDRFVGSKRQDKAWTTFEYKMRYNEL